MTTANYDLLADDAAKRAQWLVEIDMLRCDNQYTQAPCTAPDGGDGLRCWYSFPTCQDRVNYVTSTRTLYFCFQDVPWSDDTLQVYPLLQKLVAVPQKIDARRLHTFPEQLNLSMALDYLPPPPDHDKGSAFFNTGSPGEFWANLFARNLNYSGRPVRVKRGFYSADDFALADFQQIGPEYRLKAYSISDAAVKITCESKLADLDKRQIPFAVSDDNLITDAAGISSVATTINVTSAAEFPDPAEFTRNTMYVEIENEIMELTAIDTALDTLTVANRGSFGTSPSFHPMGAQVTHVVGFSSDVVGTPDNPMEIMQDLLEWAGIAAADVDTTSFDTIKEVVWPEDNCARLIRRPKKVSELLQQLRETRGVAIFLDTSGKFAAATLLPDEDGTALTDTNFIEDSLTIEVDDEARISRVLYLYDPVEDNASNTDDFAKVVVEINTDLEDANLFGDKREKVILDQWLDPGAIIAEVRNIARRLISRFRFGLRTFTFQLEIADATAINVGDALTVNTFKVLGVDGAAETRPVLVTAKREVDRTRVEFQAVDVNFSGRFFRMGPEAMTATYTDGDANLIYGYWGDASDNTVGVRNVDGYIYF